MNLGHVISYESLEQAAEYLNSIAVEEEEAQIREAQENPRETNQTLCNIL